MALLLTGQQEGNSLKTSVKAVRCTRLQLDCYGGYLCQLL